MSASLAALALTLALPVASPMLAISSLSTLTAASAVVPAQTLAL